MGRLRLATAMAPGRKAELPNREATTCNFPPGFRFPVTDTEILEAPLLYLHARYVARKHKKWENLVCSEHAACDDLYEWFSFLGGAAIDWRDVETDDIVGYRDTLERSVSPRTRQPYKPNTVRRRLGTILRFHAWADGMGYTSVAPPPEAERRGRRTIDTNPLAHVGPSASRFAIPDILPSQERSEPSPFPGISNLRAVLLALGPETRRRDWDLRPSRDRLASTFALVTGARLSETLAVTLADVLGLCRNGTSQLGNVRLLLEKTKGGTPRKVLLPNWLLDELLVYADTERSDAVARARAAGRNPPPNLFLNGTDASNRDVGRALTARTLSRRFQSAVISAGLTGVVPDGTGAGLPDRIVAAHTFHDLRHTFAVLQYLARKARGEAEPWKPIATLLGHRSAKTTMDFYLRPVSLAESNLSDVLSDYIGSLFSIE